MTTLTENAGQPPFFARSRAMTVKPCSTVYNKFLNGSASINVHLTFISNTWWIAIFHLYKRRPVGGMYIFTTLAFKIIKVESCSSILFISAYTKISFTHSHKAHTFSYSQNMHLFTAELSISSLKLNTQWTVYTVYCSKADEMHHSIQ